MNHGYCQFGDSYYKQVQGTVMGTPVAPPYSNIYIAAKLEAVVQQQSAYWPTIYKRFIDDGFFVWEQDYARLLLFLQALNSTLPNIRLTWQVSQTSIDYMDITIRKCMDSAGVQATAASEQTWLAVLWTMRRACICWLGWATYKVPLEVVTSSPLGPMALMLWLAEMGNMIMMIIIMRASS
jgi:hypothetical protein